MRFRPAAFTSMTTSSRFGFGTGRSSMRSTSVDPYSDAVTTLTSAPFASPGTTAATSRIGRQSVAVLAGHHVAAVGNCAENGPVPVADLDGGDHVLVTFGRGPGNVDGAPRSGTGPALPSLVRFECAWTREDPGHLTGIPAQEDTP